MSETYVLLLVLVALGLLTTAWVAISVSHLPNLDDEPEDSTMSFLVELWEFSRVRKKFWLLPLLLIVVAVNAICVDPPSSRSKR